MFDVGGKVLTKTFDKTSPFSNLLSSCWHRCAGNTSKWLGGAFKSLVPRKLSPKIRHLRRPRVISIKTGRLLAPNLSSCQLIFRSRSKLCCWNENNEECKVLERVNFVNYKPILISSKPLQLHRSGRDSPIIPEESFTNTGCPLVSSPSSAVAY